MQRARGPGAATLRIAFNSDSFTGPTARATLEGFADSVGAQVTTADSVTFTATIQNAHFAKRDYRCFSGDAESDDFGPEWLDGYAPLFLTMVDAERTFKPYLVAKYGQAYTRASRNYTKCANIFKNDDGSQAGECWAEFGTGKTWRLIIATVNVEPDGYAVSIDSDPFVRKWQRKWRKAGSKCFRSGGLGPIRGTLYSNGFGCDVRMASEIFKGRTGWHGTRTGSFPKVVSYKCTRRARTYTCANSMGDAFRWTPARSPAGPQRAASAPSRRKAPARRASGCDRNYSGF